MWWWDFLPPLDGEDLPLECEDAGSDVSFKIYLFDVAWSLTFSWTML